MARDDMKRKKENSPPLQLLSTAGQQVNLKKKKKKQRPTPLAEQESSDYTTNKSDKKKASFMENEKKQQRKKANGSSEIYDGDDDAKQLGEKDYAGSNSQKYALDPTDPQYKRSAAFARQRVKKQKNADAKVNTWEQVHDAVPEDVMTSTELFADRKDDFLSTIRSLKRNVGTLKNQPKAR